MNAYSLLFSFVSAVHPLDPCPLLIISNTWIYLDHECFPLLNISHLQIFHTFEYFPYFPPRNVSHPKYKSPPTEYSHPLNIKSHWKFSPEYFPLHPATATSPSPARLHTWFDSDFLQMLQFPARYIHTRVFFKLPPWVWCFGAGHRAAVSGTKKQGGETDPSVHLVVHTHAFIGEPTPTW